MKLNIGCGTHYASGWINIDLHRDEAANIRPDVVASLDALPYNDGSITRLYAGHCLEHIRIDDAQYLDAGHVVLGRPSSFDAAMQEVRRVLAPNGIACFVCPDVYKALHWWKDGNADWALVDACLEGPDDGIDPASAWDGCFHAWNCNEARLLGHVARTFPDAVAVSMESQTLRGFPVVSRAGWQCAVMTRP